MVLWTMIVVAALLSHDLAGVCVLLEFI
jgi:hypothetical protein